MYNKPCANEITLGQHDKKEFAVNYDSKRNDLKKINNRQTDMNKNLPFNVTPHHKYQPLKPQDLSKLTNNFQK